MDWLTRGAVPDHGSFALVGDTNGDRQVTARTRLCHHGRCHIDGGLPDIFRIMLDPAVGWECRGTQRIAVPEWFRPRRTGLVVPWSMAMMKRRSDMGWPY